MASITSIVKLGSLLIITYDDGVVVRRSIVYDDTVVSEPPTGYTEVGNIYVNSSGNLIINYNGSSIEIQTDDLTGDEMVTLLEALGVGSRLSHTKLDDVGASDHHTKYTNTEAVTAAKADADIADALTKKHTQNTDTDLDATFEATFEKVVNKGAVSGYASLNASTKVTEQPASITDHLDDTEHGTDALTTKAPTSNRLYDHDVATTGVHSFDKSARVYHNCHQSIPSSAGVGTTLDFNSERFDTDTMHTDSLEGTADNLRAGELEDTSEDFSATVSVGYKVWNTTDNTSALVNDVTNAAAGRLGLDTDIFDTGNESYTITEYPSRLTCKTAGKYIITATFRFGPNITGVRQGVILLNGTTTISMAQFNAATVGRTAMNIVTLYDLGVGDYVEIVALQNSGDTLEVPASPQFSAEFMMARIA